MSQRAARGTPPLHLRIHAHLKERIEAGEWAFGAVLPSEIDLCTLYHISRGTVRLVLAALENEGLVRRERGRGTFVTFASPPKAPSGLGDHSIAFIVPYVRDSFVATLLLGLESAARAGGYAVVFSHVENDLQQQEQALRQARQQALSGIVLYPVNSTQLTPSLLELSASRYPLVLVDRYIRCLFTDFVSSDNFGGALCATQHLLQLGHSRIAFLSWNEPAISFEHRKAGYRQALLEAGLLPQDSLEWQVVGYPTIDQAALAQLLLQPQPPSALFAANDQLAIAVQRLARDLHIAIPADLALVGFDDLDISAQLEIPLTTVAQSAFDLGKTAGELILARIADPAAPLQRRFLPTQLIVRRSCGASPLSGS